MRARLLSPLGRVQGYEPLLSNPVATWLQLFPSSTETSRVTESTLTLSEALQVMLWVEAGGQNSPPLGETTAQTGPRAARSGLSCPSRRGPMLEKPAIAASVGAGLSEHVPPPWPHEFQLVRVA